MKTIAILIATLVISVTPRAQNDNDRIIRYTQRDGTQVELHWGQPDRPPARPPPAFGWLDANSNGSIDHNEARGYGQLADDFLYADRNHDGCISAREYARWVDEP